MGALSEGCMNKWRELDDFAFLDRRCLGWAGKGLGEREAGREAGGWLGGLVLGDGGEKCRRDSWGESGLAGCSGSGGAALLG
jgi:hypothetical protein